MAYGFRIVQDMIDGLSNYMDEMGFKSVSEIVGKAVPTVSDWRYLNLNHISKAVINQGTWTSSAAAATLPAKIPRTRPSH